MAAYVVPLDSQLSPVPEGARAALKDARVQLNDSLPVQLGSGAAKSAVADRSAIERRSIISRLPRPRVQTLLLGGATALVLIALGWRSVSIGAARRTEQAVAASSSAAVAAIGGPAAGRDDPAVACLQESSHYQPSGDRDQILLDAINEFNQGRLETAHTAFKKYTTYSCDRATLEAAAILERQSDSKSRE